MILTCLLCFLLKLLEFIERAKAELAQLCCVLLLLLQSNRVLVQHRLYLGGQSWWTEKCEFVQTAIKYGIALVFNSEQSATAKQRTSLKGAWPRGSRPEFNCTRCALFHSPPNLHAKQAITLKALSSAETSSE